MARLAGATYGGVSARTVGRLSVYRRILAEAAGRSVRFIHSHELASNAGVTAAQVRRDLMVVGYEGSPKRGYEVSALYESLGEFLDRSGEQPIGIFGVGNLGRALLSYFNERSPRLSIVAAFDIDEQKAGRVIHGCRCYRPDEFPAIMKEKGIKLVIVAVPARFAQEVADRVVRAGVRGILNFAPMPLKLPPNVYVENLDVTMSLEKVAFFAQQAA